MAQELSGVFGAWLAMVSEEQWKRLHECWFELFTEEAFKPGFITQFLCKKTGTMKYGQVDRVLKGASAFVKIADGVFMELKKEEVIWSYVPSKYLEKAKQIIDFVMDVRTVLQLTSVEGVRLVVTSAAAEATFGAASVTSGLATLGGGSVASGGLGMVGGIFVVAAAPSTLTAHAIYNLCSAMENNSITPTAVAVGGVGGAVAGSTIGVIMVAESGAVAGLSASGITSGLAALGGGSIASGGLGMLGGVAAVASGTAVIAAAVGGTVWLVAHVAVEERLKA